MTCAYLTLILTISCSEKKPKEQENIAKYSQELPIKDTKTDKTVTLNYH